MDNQFMSAAIAEAEKAALSGEVPVGAVLVKANRIIWRAHNLTCQLRDVTAHAEMLTIRGACSAFGDWRLDGCDLYVTLEPCPMCLSTIFLSRIRRLYFGAYDPELGAISGKIDLSVLGHYHQHTEIYGGMMEAKCEALLTDFFREIRNS